MKRFRTRVEVSTTTARLILRLCAFAPLRHEGVNFAVADRTRRQWIDELFPAGIPRLWCPPLTHFRAAGQIAPDRMARHLLHLGRHARGWLVPGSTGEGWLMSDQEVRTVLDHALTIAAKLDVRVLVGVLRQQAAAAIDCIHEIAEWLCERAGTSDVVQALVTQHVCGFTVCPPTGESLGDDDIATALRSVLQLQLPTALYQLPQITKNEMSPEVVAEFAAEFPHFYLFKDTSGLDRVALSAAALEDVFLVRGAEGKYSRWLKSAGGPYNGFLLSTANVFADRLDNMIQRIERFDDVEARRQIEPVERAVEAVFARVANYGRGNPFTNANKAIDHFMAYGARAPDTPGPMLYDGHTLAPDLLDDTRSILKQYSLLPEIGYLADT
jgi:dihydrodipicolinate synthase/N-acetylneuraminate lyase